MNDAEEYVVLVDAADNAMGVAPKLRAHIEGLRHRAISVFVTNSNGELLLQRRHVGKYHSGGLWTNTCCSHPRPEEPSGAAAHRRLAEEMGFVCPLHPLFTTSYCAPLAGGLIENELVHVYGGVYDGDVAPDPTEVDNIKWLAPDLLVRDVESQPDTYTVWFAKYVREFLPEIEILVSEASASTVSEPKSRRGGIAPS
jgi:isopentenyl-diphosphate Delta-isomerase